MHCTDERCHDGRGHTYESGCELGRQPILRPLPPGYEPKTGRYFQWFVLLLALGYVVYLVAHLLVAVERG